MSTLAVIFDMDGVLIDSYEAHFAGWSQMYAELNLDYTEEDFAADFGRTSRDILFRRFGDQLADARIRELDERKEALFRDSLRSQFTAMDGATELIDALTAVGFRLGIGSSAPPENIDLCLEKLGCRGKISAVITGKDVSRGKPDPQVFQLAASRLGVPANHCAVIEDAVHGIEAANRAEMISVALTGTATREQLAEANLIVDSLRELSPQSLRALVEG
ncbi:MAG TPA: HAD family phosphatase [Lacipirellulaceae bacterium]|jgi:beta-phosphoglucomutase|nr:HAD family phosphatase [Lacipirellulaceae bacterium]